MNQLIREWKKAKKIQILDMKGNPIEDIRGFGLTYDDYKSKTPSYLIKKR